MSKTKNKTKTGSTSKKPAKQASHKAEDGAKSQKRNEAPHTPISGLNVTRPSLKDVKFKAPPRRGSIYQPILDLMAAYKPGDKPIQVEIPNGITPRVLHNRLNATIRRVGPRAPKGYFWQKRTGDDGGKEVVLILLEKGREDLKSA